MSQNLTQLTLATALALGAVLSTPAQAIPLLDGFGGPAGFGATALSANDDGSTSAVLPFGMNFFGNNYASGDNFFINNNGNITFNGAVGAFTPQPFPVSGQPMIAPYWADVDTRGSGSGLVYIAAPNPDTFVVTWNNVGFYPSRADLTNNFQMVVRNRADTGAGNFDVDFRYDRLEWTTGDASGGTDGLGGTPAQAGYDAGDATNFFQLPGSFTANVLNLQNTSNVSNTTPGLWTFAFRDGAPPDGSTPSNPLLPIVTEAGFTFDFEIGPGETIFIDPPVAIGYEYTVQGGPNFASVLIPAALPGGDDTFDLIVDGITYTLTAGTAFDLTSLNLLGFNAFTILGIEVAEGLDPNDPFAFVTGLTFVGGGSVQMTQTPITFDTGANVPVPATWLLMALSLIAARQIRRRATQH